MRRRSLPCLLSVLNTHSRASFRPSSPNYDDVFVNDAARQRLRINSARHWTDKVEHRLRTPETRTWPSGRKYLQPHSGGHYERALTLAGANEDGGGGLGESSRIGCGDGGPVFASRRPAGKLEMRASCPAAEAPGPAALLSKLPQFANSPGLYPGGLHPGCAELAHMANNKGAAF